MSWVPPDEPPTEPPTSSASPLGTAGSGSADQRDVGVGGPGTWSDDRRSGRGRRTLVIAAVAAVLVVVAGVATLLLATADGDDPVAAPPPSTPEATDPTTAEPEPTDPTTTTEQQPSTTTTTDSDAEPAPGAAADLEGEVAGLSDYVAEARGAPFPEPVAVELLEGDAFNERLLVDFEEERDQIQLTGRLFVALGLLEPEQDLFEIFRDFLGVGVIGFYDPETAELVVRGADITPYTRSTIVHELVHAHDDQRFELFRPELDDAVDESGLGFSALVEGNAVRIQQAWEANELSADEQDELFAEQLAGVAGLDIGEIPLVLLQQIDFPYSAGPVLVEALADEGGEERIDGAFADPPTTSEQVIDPEAYLSGEGALPVPAPPADGEVVDEGSFGQLTLQLTLGGEIDRETARQAAEGWGGDAYVAWFEGEAACVRIAFRMDTPADLAELDEAWRSWAAEQPSATVTGDGEAVTVTSCA